MAAAFLAAPTESVRGWEIARAAQGRAAVEKVVRDSSADCDVAIVAHGAVGMLLLWRDDRRLLSGWEAID